MRFKTCDRSNSVVWFNSTYRVNSSITFVSPCRLDWCGRLKSPNGFNSPHIGFCSAHIVDSSTFQWFEFMQRFSGSLTINAKFLTSLRIIAKFVCVAWDASKVSLVGFKCTLAILSVVNNAVWISELKLRNSSKSSESDKIFQNLVKCY